MKLLKNSRGQGLVEYLILVALMAVATLGVVRTLNQTVNAQFTDVIYAIKGSKKRSEKDAVNESIYKKRDLSDFMNGSTSGKSK
ncbi:MAG: Flp family type IVb pilin [Pseudobdellovibrionaceae bacterium]|nr:Flp family type IVb pilin [Bdellovibrionales bacterium]USN47353.1 MAG: Flp family type IVb pilin [Pseudobdellovibrionaceae bacterium]